MGLIQKIRFSMGTIMMFVLMVAAGMALFVKVQNLTELVTAPAGLPPGWNLDVPSLFLLALALTAVALGSWKEHSAVQIMLQITIACVGCLTLIWISEAKYDRAIRYWCQGTFAATVTLPMLGRRFAKSGLPRGPRRDWWKKTCEAAFYSFLTMILVSAGGLLQAAVYVAASAIPPTNMPLVVVPPSVPTAPSPPASNTAPAPVPETR